ncbi:transcriptional regulator [Streptomyces spirodelae]|uniref:Transcriptional regulator n=1 Tax=Streptomyces spirodelae TaxID=2812904 RepID=A0ABS3WY13_9ACTN|nr:transcriptional regulator [Streptomyces spirodelae]MBO8187746.1 transcriptional regulator [Streptomyces spirodelae]
METAAPVHAPALLHRLAEERVTGAFTRAGGTLFLVDGEIVHAESAAATGLELLLTRDCALSPARWDAALTRAERDGGVARQLMAGGQVPEGVLDLCRRTALYDAAFFVLASGGGPGRFRHGVRDRLGAHGGVPPMVVERETARRLALLDRIWPDARLDVLPPVPTARAAPAAPQDVGVPLSAVPDRRLPVLRLADGVRTATDIARALARPAFHILVELRRLAAAGLVTPAGPAAAGTPHTAGTAAAAATPFPTGARPSEAPGAVFDAPDVELLRRLRDALEAL